jgi:hypothetical protein
MPRSPNPDQGSLFAPPPPPESVRHATDPHVYLPAARPTQVAAAAAVRPRTGTQRARVLDAIRTAGRDGLIDEEIEDALHLDGNSARPRRKELEEGGLIVDSGQRRQHAGEVARGA